MELDGGLYNATYVGETRLERYRLHLTDGVARTYLEMAELVTALRGYRSGP